MRTHVVLPAELVEEIDRIAGKRGRSRFIEDAIERQLRRERLKAGLDATRGMLKDHLEDYPYLATPEKTSEWVRGLRALARDEVDRKRPRS